MNIGTFSENILDSDLSLLLSRWKEKDKFCGDIRVLEVDDSKDIEIILFEDCTFKSVEAILLQCPYLGLIMNDEGTFHHTGVNLNIEFLFTTIWMCD